MKKSILSILCAFLLFPSLIYAQVTMPFTNCPTSVAVARSGFNAYNNEPVYIYNLNTATGVATPYPGGPLKDPAAPANNMDINAVGLNGADGFLYAMSTGTPTPKFYRIGSNYSIEELGVLVGPPPVSPADYAIINSAAGEVDPSGNYYFTAVTGNISFFPVISFTPQDYYIGKIPSVQSRVSGTGNIEPIYTKIDFSAASCSQYASTLMTASTVATAQNTGIRDLVFNIRDGKLYSYVSYETPASSGTFRGELIRMNVSTGVVECYPSTTLPFANTSNEVAGTSISPSGVINILFTGGNLYRTDMSTPTTYTGTITYTGNTGISTQLRGDLASCITSAAVVPVNFLDFTATENNCRLDVKWAVAQEQNVATYDVEVLDKGNVFTSAARINATNSAFTHSYNNSIPVTSKTMTVRIRRTDFDGSYAYSNIIRVNTVCERTQSISLINSGSLKSNLQVRWNNMRTTSDYSLTVYNAYGATLLKKVVRVDPSTVITELNTSALPSGAYIIVAQSPDGNKFTERFIR